MTNQEIAEILYKIADLQDMLGIAWKPVAFRRAARTIESLAEDLDRIYRREGIDGLTQLPTIGDAIAKKIVQFLTSGTVDELERLKQQIPKGVLAFLDIPGLGPKKAWKLYKLLGVETIEQLENAARDEKVRTLDGFGEKSEAELLTGIALVKQGIERKLLGEVLPLAEELLMQIRRLPDVSRADIAGSVRRKKETCKDIDILVVAKKPDRVMTFFTSLPAVAKIISKGSTKSAVCLKQGLNVDLRVVSSQSYGAALNYFTGSKEHNVTLRQLAIKNGLKLNEYGLFKNEKQIAGATEEDVYRKLGLKYVEPELRENTGEIQAAQNNSLPNLVSLADIQGDCHMHTTWSDGAGTTEDMIRACIAKGYAYIAITDHSKTEFVANGLDEKRVVQHCQEIDALQKKYPSIRIFKGAEIDILADGSLDYSKKTLDLLDFRIGAVHSGFKQTREQITQRYRAAIETGMLHVLAHPTGRLINQRNPLDLDFETICNVARTNSVALEINAIPSRLDLSDNHIRQARNNACKLIVNTDAHSVASLDLMSFGISQARRGWATKEDIINTLSLKKFEKWMQRKQRNA